MAPSATGACPSIPVMTSEPELFDEVRPPRARVTVRPLAGASSMRPPPDCTLRSLTDSTVSTPELPATRSLPPWSARKPPLASPRRSARLAELLSRSNVPPLLTMKFEAVAVVATNA